MNIKPVNIFVTPENMKDLEDRLNSFSDSEKSVAWMGAMMAWNLACKLVDGAVDTEETDPMTTLTIKQAKKLGQDLVSGTAVKAKVTTTVQTLYTAHCGGDIKADKPLDSKSLILPETLLVALWEQCVTDKPTLAVIRSIFNRVTKAVHKELDIDKPAMCVKNGQLVEVQKRGRKGGVA
jgi:hypothetical protein